MTNSIKINSGSIVATDNIRFVRPIDDDERARIVERYGDDAEGFNISIQFADKTSKLATQTIDDLKEQGVTFVNIGADRHVIAANIKTADPFTKEQAQSLVKDKGYTINQTFRSRVDTTAGTMLSSATPDQIMERRAKALGLG